MFCNKCGKEIPNESSYCNYCGNKIGENNSNKFKIIMIICIIITICAIITCISFCIDKKESENEQVSQANQTTQTTSKTYNLEGRYSNRLAMIESEGYGTSYNTYYFENGKVEYTEEYIVYIGKYNIVDNKVFIEYIEAQEMDMTVELDKFSDVLTINNDNEFITSSGERFNKD